MKNQHSIDNKSRQNSRLKIMLNSADNELRNNGYYEQAGCCDKKC